MSKPLGNIFVELCVQRDFVDPQGTHRCLNAGELVGGVKRAMAYARWSRTPVLSCIDDRFPSPPRQAIARAHCPTEDAKGPFTLMPTRVVVQSDNCPCVSLDVITRYRQVILTKSHDDPFTNPKLDRLLTELPARRFVVFGVAMERSIRILALGLLRRTRNVTVLSDACGHWDAEDASMARRQLEVKGCELIDTHTFISRELQRYSRNPLRRWRRKRVA